MSIAPWAISSVQSGPLLQSLWPHVIFLISIVTLWLQKDCISWSTCPWAAGNCRTRTTHGGGHVEFLVYSLESFSFTCLQFPLCLKTYLGFHLAHFQAVEERRTGKTVCTAGNLHCTHWFDNIIVGLDMNFIYFVIALRAVSISPLYVWVCAYTCA